MVKSCEQLITILEDTANALQKTKVNLGKCPKARLTKGYLETRLQSVEKYWNTFQNAHQELINTTPKEKRADIPYIVNEEYFIYEDLYLCLSGDLRDMLSALEKGQSVKNQQTQLTASLEDKIKLPCIQPPVFTGNYEDWPTFQDLFLSLIHNNLSLTNVMKLHFLKNSVSGEALSLLKNISITDQNYTQAWNILKERYGNKRIIVNTIMKRLFSQKKIYAQTASQIKSLLDTTSECLNSLRNLEISIDTWDPMIVYMVVLKLDTETHKDWEEHSFKGSSNELPTWRDLRGFLETKFRTLEFISNATSPSTSQFKQNTHKSFYVSSAPAKRTCIKCNDDHTLSHCKEFSNLSTNERIEFAKTNNLCFNCLLYGHSVFKCRLQTSCQICNRRHHSLLHVNNENVSAHLGQIEDIPDSKEVEEEPVNISANLANQQSTALLATALVPVRDETGRVMTLRALIDQGSQASFITERAVQLMKLKKLPTKGTITGVGSTKTFISSKVQCEILSRYEAEFKLKIDAYVLTTKVTSELPSKAINKVSVAWTHLENLELADPSYYQPGRIDMLLGVEVYAQILRNNIIKGPPGSPCAQNTSLGWILFGDVLDQPSENLIVLHHQVNLDQLVRTMWELEPAEKPELTAEEKLCEKIYAHTTTRTETGRYIVKLPTKTENLKSTEGDTRSVAIKRFNQLERKLENNTNFKTEYTKVIEEYLSLGHMEEVPKIEINNPAVYLPHHAVIREDKETTKLRVVFDASSKGTNNISLNDELLVGPQLQDDMRNIIMRWRLHRICYVADIQKMYRQIMVHKKDADLQRIIWRRNSRDPLQEYRLCRVTFGTASAPYLAVKTMHKVAEDEGIEHPEAVKTIKEDFYMDDLMSGQDTVEEAVHIAKTIKVILKAGGFDLQKWSSNSAEFLAQFDNSERSNSVNMNIKLDGTIRALGLLWHIGEDNFQYQIELTPPPKPITKRNILAETQKLFDPLGWLTPSTIEPKMIIQDLWVRRSSWDEEVDPENKEKWLKIRENLKYLKEIKIERWLHTTKQLLDKTSIHGFCDASSKAYAAVAYLRVETENGEIKTNIIAAKARVAPVKPLSTPRLELCGGALLAKLLKQIKDAMRIPENQIFAWTDSTIVLSWLQGEPNRWQTFVRNRVVSILDDIGDNWYHVKTQDNPADIASRGAPLDELMLDDMWWKGPRWLQTKEIPFEQQKLTTDLEMKNNMNINVKIQEEGDFTERFKEFTNLLELTKAVSYCKRFLAYKRSIQATVLTTEEIDNSKKICIKLVQTKSFEDDINRLKQKKQVRKDSPLKTLDPYLDEENILRVGGRLRHSNLSKESKHPIILDSKNQLIPLLVDEAHQKTLHGGVPLMLCYLRNQYWIIRPKGIVKSHIKKCLVCARQSAIAKKQFMGDLPKQRITPARPFLNSGVDFAGPYQTLMSRGRGVRLNKSYIAIFVCMATRAIHLELVSDLTSEAFIGAYRRFVSRRGKCAHLWSDQGRNFVGASKALAEAFIEAKLDWDGEISKKLAEDGTQWHFIPCYSPNFGGLWEAGVKALKHHLKRTLDSHLTFEEMSTLLCQIEACLNSRPYNNITEDDYQTPLTPGHFLIGESTVTVPSPTFTADKIGHLSRWQHLQKLLNDFWRRWQQEYISKLQQRRKWAKREEDLEVGQIVLIKNEALPPGKWLMGRVIKKHPGTDGLTRVYSVKSGDSIVKRSVSKLCYFPVDINESE